MLHYAEAENCIAHPAGVSLHLAGTRQGGSCSALRSLGYAALSRCTHLHCMSSSCVATFDRGKPRRQLKHIAEPEEPSAGAQEDASDEDSDLLKPVFGHHLRPAVNLGHLSGLGASAQGEHCLCSEAKEQHLAWTIFTTGARVYTGASEAELNDAQVTATFHQLVRAVAYLGFKCRASCGLVRSIVCIINKQHQVLLQERLLLTAVLTYVQRERKQIWRRMWRRSQMTLRQMLWPRSPAGPGCACASLQRIGMASETVWNSSGALNKEACSYTATMHWTMKTKTSYLE